MTLQLETTIDPTPHGNFIWTVRNAALDSVDCPMEFGVDFESGIEPERAWAEQKARQATIRLTAIYGREQ